MEWLSGGLVVGRPRGAAIAAAAVEYKHMMVNDKTLEAWVKLTADVDTETASPVPLWRL